MSLEENLRGKRSKTVRKRRKGVVNRKGGDGMTFSVKKPASLYEPFAEKKRYSASIPLLKGGWGKGNQVLPRCQ